MSVAPTTRESAAILTGWSALVACELWLAAGGMVRPAWSQIGFEVLGAFVLAGAQIRLARTPAQRSPLVPAVLVLAGTAVVLGPDGVVHAGLAGVGAVGIAVAAVRFGARRSIGPVLAGFAAALATIGARWLLLAHASSLETAHLQGAVAVSDAETRLVADLAGPFRGGGEGDPALPPIVLITVDTLRADHAVRMESYRRLAGRGIAWPAAASTSSWTLPAMASVMTGQMPAGHGADARPGGVYQGIDPGAPMLAEDLRARGYTTAAFVTNPWLESTLGFSRGFDLFVHANEAFPGRLLLAGMPQGPVPIDAEVVVDRALGWIEGQQGGGWFVWIHLLDPHMPYLNADPESVAATIVDGDLRSGRLLTEAHRDEIKAAYANEVAHADAHLGRLLDALEAAGVFERGAVLMTADHGEEFWDHGGAEHGHSHHREVTDVALALAAPACVGQRGGVASLVDVRPTLRAIAGLDPGGIDLRAGVPADRVATAWGNNYFRLDRSARDASGRVIVYGSPWGGAPVEAFDHLRDREELMPQPALDGPVLRAAIAVQAPEEGAEAAINVEALRALGYVK